MRHILRAFLFTMCLPLAGHAQQASRPLLTGLTPPIATVQTQSMQYDADALRSAVSRRSAIAAGIGFVVGAGATWYVLNSGGSTAPCDRDANQDALSTGECAGITILGGGVGALLGVIISRWL